MIKNKIAGVLLLIIVLVSNFAIVENVGATTTGYEIQPDETNSKDTYIRYLSGGEYDNFGNSGSLLIGKNGEVQGGARTCIKFDLTNVPGGINITGVSLFLKINADNSSNARIFNIYRLIDSFGESTASWLIRDGGAWWNGSGGTNNVNWNVLIGSSSFTSSESIDTTKEFVFSSEGVQQVKDMIGGSVTNNGWMIISESENNDQYSFYSASDSTAGNRPNLVIYYDAPTETPTNTITPTNTFTPTTTLTSTITFTPTVTLTPTITFTPTVTLTPTITLTGVPTLNPSIVWADGPEDLSPTLLNEIASLLISDPPDEEESNVYAVTNISGQGTTWNISLVNLVGVSPPYNEWDAETNAVWSWFVVCVGTEPSWSCEYYDMPDQGGSGSDSIHFPWAKGYSAWYGVSGVHRDTNSIIPESYAVDFLGGDSMGASSMLPSVFSASGGTITWVCDDGVSMGIRVGGGKVPMAYFHFDAGQDFSEGQTVNQGQLLGSLKYGSFSGSSCGWAAQQADQYHLHFVFLPTTSGFLTIGNCVLNLDTQSFVCNGSTYGPQSWIPNGSDDPSDPTPTTGAHLWDGIVDLFVKLSADTVSQYLPTQNSIVGYVMQKANLLVQFSFELYFTVYSAGLTGAVLTLLLAAILSMEITMKVIELMIYLWKEFGWLLKFLVPI